MEFWEKGISIRYIEFGIGKLTIDLNNRRRKVDKGKVYEASFGMW